MTNEKGDVSTSRKRRKESQKSPRSAHQKGKPAVTESADKSGESPAAVIAAPSEPPPPTPESKRSAKRAAKRERDSESAQSGFFSKCFHIGKYVILVLVLPAILNHASLYREAAELKPQGELYDVGWNHKMLLHCTGTGSPTVVLDAPTGMTSDVWCLIQPRIAKFTRVCSYDRAGLGFSERTPVNYTSESYSVVNEKRGQVSTVERMADDLYHLLQVSSDQPQPFIMVGSELGSVNARFFTQMYESVVSDLVLIDPLAEGVFEMDDGIWSNFWFEHLVPSFESLQLSAAIGLSRIALLLGLMEQPITGNVIPDNVVMRQKYLMCQPRHLSSIVDEHYFINQSFAQLRTALTVKPFPKSVSVTVITGNYYDEQLPSSLNKVWAKAQQRLMSKAHTDAKHILINGADHHMLYRNPNSIVEPVRKLVKQWRVRHNGTQETNGSRNSGSNGTVRSEKS